MEDDMEKVICFQTIFPAYHVLFYLVHFAHRTQYIVRNLPITFAWLTHFWDHHRHTLLACQKR